MPHQARAKIPILLTKAQHRSKVISAPNPLLLAADVTSILSRRCRLQQVPSHPRSCSSSAHSPSQKHILRLLPQGLLEEPEEDGLCGVWGLFSPVQSISQVTRGLSRAAELSSQGLQLRTFQQDPSVHSDTLLPRSEVIS